MRAPYILSPLINHQCSQILELARNRIPWDLNEEMGGEGGPLVCEYILLFFSHFGESFFFSLTTFGKEGRY